MEIKAVELMRGIRDRISRETADMSFAEFKAYVEAHSPPASPRCSELPGKLVPSGSGGRH